MAIRISNQDVLLVIDIQNDFCTGGALAVPDGEQVVPVVNRIASHFDHIVLTQDWHPPGHSSFASSHTSKQPFDSIEVAYGQQTLWPDHCVIGTSGAAFHPGLHLEKAELILRKGFRKEIDSYSAFTENDRRISTGLAGYLRERNFQRVFLTGLAYDYCVRFSALGSIQAGFETYVFEDSCKAINLQGSVDDTKRDFAAAGIHSIIASHIE